jgi:hypothetical protein
MMMIEKIYSVKHPISHYYVFTPAIMLARLSFITSFLTVLTMHTTKINAFSFSKLKYSPSQEVSSSRVSTRRYDPSVLSADDHNHCFSSTASSTNVSAFILSLTILTNTFGAPAMAVSGGGLDYANIDITGQVGCCVGISL